MNATPGQPTPRPKATPCRGLFSTPVVVYCTEVELREEHVLLEHLLQCCMDTCARSYGQAEVLSSQALPPETVSLMEPPDRIWLVRLRCRKQGPQGHPEEVQEVQALVTLRGQELCLLFL